MEKIFEVIIKSPLPIIFIIFGFLFLSLSFFTKIGEKIELDKRGRITAFIVGLFSVILGTYFHIYGINEKSFSKSDHKICFNDTFDDNVFNWPILKNKKYNRYINEGTYVFDNKTDKEQGISSLKLPDLPSSYEIIVESIHISGEKNRPFGFNLGFDSLSYYQFQATASGYAGVQLQKNGNRETFNMKKIFNYIDKTKIIQKIKVNGNSYEYFVNDKFVENRVFNQFAIKRGGLFVEGIQKVAFDTLTIRTSLKKWVVLYV